ncbi:MAG: BtpA/SgcQ family protein [Candidatus Faecousia sp.]|nr:BtpA/SgcQ family protein [Candidatus Faecousia sp.]
MFTQLWGGKKPVIGMVHLKALPGSPRYEGRLEDIYEFALRDAEALAEGGVDAIQIENQFDTPYRLGDEIGAETVAFLTAAAVRIKTRFPQVPLGINVHLNGAVQAMAIAKAVGADFIRCFNLMNAYISNSGYVGAAAPELMRYRAAIDAKEVMVFGDFQVKHGSHAITADRSLQEKAHDIQVSGADAAILTGSATGVAPDEKMIREIKQSLSIPLLIGSGLNAKNAAVLWQYADGAIIGSGFKKGGDLSAPVDRELVKAFMALIP